ncbi:kinesin-like protein [Moniliophthora roreri MCA 2997]|uniref:Kinesin-like protein n=1 Tax=Moniliophthora roreri (strain MCA 2997) TaxID=1381753 RepID=V2XRK5_MONRO|nr:kinesin-like protein [Moniliophthora roreri MCA 2997]
MSSTSSTPASKLARHTLFTPKRPSSIASNTPSSQNLLSSTHKRYKASISTESRPRNYIGKPKPTLPAVPGTPTKDSPSDSNGRPRTPGTPRSKSRQGRESPSLMPAMSEMDVSNVDPEEVLVDYQTVEPGDVSGEMDEAMLRAIQLDHGKQDKVMVSIRVRPTSGHSAWNSPQGSNSIQLDPAHARNPNLMSSNPSSLSTAPPTTYHFDSILTGIPNKPIYTTVARSHVHAAMEGFNAVIFAYGQTASGKTYTLSGDENEPGIIPRAMRDVFGFIKRTPDREYLLRCSYLEIYNETIYDLLAPPMGGSGSQVQIQGGTGMEVILTPLREEVVTSLKGVNEVLRRGERHRRTACTDWNERSSRSHSVFRLVIESRERGSGPGPLDDADMRAPSRSGRATPGNGRATPGPGNAGSRLQARGGKSVQTSILSLIDLAGSEKATSDKDRTREGKYINTSLLTLGSVIGTLSENAAKNKSDYVPYRNSKLTRMLQPSLAGNARISVICTINPDPSAVGETSSTLGFAKRVKGVKLNAQKKEIVDTDALIERYRKEIEDLKKRLADKEAASEAAPVRTRRLSAQEKMDESKAMKDLNDRIQQLTKLILTSNTVEESASDSRPASPVKVDFDLSPYQLQQELLSAKLQLETQSRQMLSLEAALEARAADEVSDDSKDKLISEQAEKIKELEGIIRGGDIGEVEREVRGAAEKEWTVKIEEEKRKREEGERWTEEVVKQLEKEKQVRIKLEDERRALTAFVSKFDALGLGTTLPSSSPVVSRRGSSIVPPMPSPRGAAAAFEERKQLRSLRARKNHSSDQVFPFPSSDSTDTVESMTTATSSSTVSSTETDLDLRSSIGEDNSPVRLGLNDGQLMLPSLLEEDWSTIMDSATGMPGDISFEGEISIRASSPTKVLKGQVKEFTGVNKENLPVS